MKCPECVKLSLRSRFQTDGTSVSTAMGGSQHYYDEDGNLHSHEINTLTSRWWCSEGHVFVRRLTPGCPSCDYGSEEWVLQPTILDTRGNGILTLTGNVETLTNKTLHSE